VPPGFWIGYAQRLAVVGLLLAGLYVAARALRRSRFFGRESGSLAVLETTALSPHAWLHLVRAGRRRFIVGSGAVTFLTDVSEADVPNEPQTLK
jgi:flagellar biogenesis protein FliO